MFFRFLILVYTCAAYPLKCPEPAQWSIRARSYCQDPSKYFCLKNDLIDGYSENCTIFDFLQPGRKNVLRGGLDADICSSERYQPWPIKFYTNVSTNCIFLKSVCNDEGQVVYDDGNRNTDATCRCDYTLGYEFSVIPRNPCFCVPLEEDCTCYLKMCNPLSTDNEYINSKDNISIHQCKPINAGRNNIERNQNDTDYIVIGKLASTLEEYKTEVAIALTFCLPVFICLLFLVLTNIISRYFKEYKNIPNKESSAIEINLPDSATLPKQLEINSSYDNPHENESCINIENIPNQEVSAVESNIPASITLRKQFRIKHEFKNPPSIYSCIKIGDQLVFTDTRNSKLLIYNSDGGHIKNIKLHIKLDKHDMYTCYTPWYITEVSNNTVAVTSGYKKTILIMDITKDVEKSIVNTIKTSEHCLGISYNDNNLYVVTDKKGGKNIMLSMDIHGNINIPTIPLPSKDIKDITVDSEKFVCVDNTTIYCCSLDGNVTWKFQNDEYQDLLRVTTDIEGNFYVINGRTRTVVVVAVSNDKNKYKEIIHESDLLDKPRGIYFDKKENMLLVCNYDDGRVFLYDVERKSNIDKHK